MKRKIVLIVALLAGAVAAVLTRFYVAAKDAEVRALKESIASRYGEVRVVVIDGAHNPHGAKALRQSLDKNFPQGRRAWLFGALRDKNFSEMIELLFRKDDFVIVTPPDSERALAPEILCAKIRERGIECVAVDDNFAAVNRLMNSVADVKIIAGSLYLIGAVRKFVRS